MSEQHEDWPRPKHLRPVSPQQARDVIIATGSCRSKDLIATASPDELASGIASLQMDYESYREMDKVPEFGKMEAAFGRLATAALSLQDAFRAIDDSPWDMYFLLIAQPRREASEEGDWVEMAATLALTSRLVSYARTAIKQVEVERSSHGTARWYEPKGKAEFWLWGEGVPALYERSFNRRYSIPAASTDTSPGLRFANAVLEVAGLPVTSQHNLRVRRRRWLTPE